MFKDFILKRLVVEFLHFRFKFKQNLHILGIESRFFPQKIFKNYLT